MARNTAFYQHITTETALKDTVIEEIKALGISSNDKGTALKDLQYSELLQLLTITRFRKGL